MELANRILEHLKQNPQITEENYCNLNPYFGRFDEKGRTVDYVYIGQDYTVTIYNGKLYLVNEETGKVNTRKIN